MGKPILCVDFDGVIHSYKSGWQGATVISDPPVPGAFSWLYIASEWWDVQISSSRSKEPGGIEAMKKYIRRYCDNDFQGMVSADALLNTLSFPTQKPPAFLSIDDRAICFNGSWASLDPQELLNFKPWNKRELGSTGDYPQGQISDDDEGELKMAVGYDSLMGLVRVEFGKPVAWLALPKENAVALAKAILEIAE